MDIRVKQLVESWHLSVDCEQSLFGGIWALEQYLYERLRSDIRMDVCLFSFILLYKCVVAFFVSSTHLHLINFEPKCVNVESPCIYLVQKLFALSCPVFIVIL